MHALLTTAIVQAPNRRTTPDILKPANHDRLAKDDATYALAWTVPVGPPAAQLAVAVVAPGDYNFIRSIQERPSGPNKVRMYPVSTWTIPQVKPDPLRPAKGTILILHGYQDAKEEMMHWALFLAQGGYRAVLVDLRGHGRSSGPWIGYGAFEVSDLRQVIDDLTRRGLASGPIGVLGVSYGASIGLQLAAADPRVGAVVALEPYADTRQGIEEFAHGVVPSLVKDWTEADFSTALDRAAKQAHFSWQDTDVYAAVAHRAVPTLYFHGQNDPWIPTRESQRLNDHTQGPHAIGYLDFSTGNPHVMLSWILDPIDVAALRWFDLALLEPGPGLRAKLAGFIKTAAPGPALKP